MPTQCLGVMAHAAKPQRRIQVTGRLLGREDIFASDVPAQVPSLHSFIISEWTSSGLPDVVGLQLHSAQAI